MTDKTPTPNWATHAFMALILTTTAGLIALLFRWLWHITG